MPCVPWVMLFGLNVLVAVARGGLEEAPNPRHRSSKPPVIVHVLVDDLGFADLGFLDSKLSTSHIDALRASGIELSSYYAWKYCNPSRAMLLTGRYMHNIGIYSNGGAPSLNFTLLPDRLKQASPSLRAVMIGKWHLGQAYRRYTPTYRGFDSWLGYYDGDEDYWNHTFPTGPCNKVNATGRCDGLCAIDFNNNSGAHGDLQVLGASFQGKYSARVFSTEAVRQIKQHASESSERGFFLYLAMQSVHGPWQAPDESVAVFSDPTVPDRFINDTLRQVYAGMLLELDYTVGNVTAALKNGDMWHDRTLLVLTSDNGGPGQGGAPPNNLPLRGGKATLWYEHTTKVITQSLSRSSTSSEPRMLAALFREGGVRVIAIVTSPSLPTSRRNSTWAGMIHATDWMPSYYSWAAASAKVTWPPEPIPGFPREPCGFDGHDMIPALWAGGESPRTEVVHAVVNQHNPPGFPDGQMAAQGYPYSCAASSFCGGALRVGDYKLLVGYPGWDEHYTYPNNDRVSPNTQLHWDVCKSHCLFDVVTDVAEMHDLSAEPAHAAILSRMLDRFWTLSNASGAILADSMFDNKQCAAARMDGFWRPVDYNGPVPPPPPAGNHTGKWQVKPGRSGCHGNQNSLGGAHLSNVPAVEAHCDRLPQCVFFIYNEKGLDPRQGKAGDAFFCRTDYFADPTTPDPGWVVGGRVVV